MQQTPVHFDHFVEWMSGAPPFPLSKPKDSTSLKTLDVLHYTVVLSDARKHAFCLTEADGKSVLCLACNSEQVRAYLS